MKRVSDTQQQQDAQMRADLSKRLQEKVTQDTEFIGKIVLPIKPKEAISGEEDC